MQLRRIALAIGMSVAALMAGAQPASADPVTAYFKGTMQVGGIPSIPLCGITVCAAAISFSFTSDTDLVFPPGSFGSGRVSGSGTILGVCGHASGRGKGMVNGHQADVDVTWEGSTFTLRGVPANHAELVIVFEAVLVDPSQGNCLTSSVLGVPIAGTGAVI